MVGTCNYKAFISYSHADESWAKWLHRALEGYRLPRQLAGEVDAADAAPLSPTFRDRDELATSSDLSAKIRGALEASENLVVICSPNAAASRWVDQEILEFQQLGREGRVFCFLVGDPDSSFPPATIAAGAEPLAADARKQGDGRQAALIKLVAGLLDLPLDVLQRREARRRTRRLALVASGSFAGMLFAIGLAMFAEASRRDAEVARDEAERVVSFMVDLFEVSDPGKSLGDEITARELLDKGAVRLLEELDDQPETRARMLSTIGNVYLNLGLYPSAEPLLEEALRTNEGLSAKAAPATADTLHLLGRLYTLDTRFDEALDAYEQSYAIRLRELGAYHSDTVTSVNSLGTLYARQGQFDKALEYLEKAVAGWEADEDQRSSLSAALSNMGNVLARDGRPAEALPHLKRALEIQSGLTGEQHPEVATTLLNLGATEADLGDLETADRRFRKALEIREKVLAPGHPQISVALNYVGRLAMMQRRYDEALPHLERALGIDIATLGADHGSTAVSYDTLGELHEARGELDLARDYYRQALDICEIVHGNEHPIFGRQLARLANVNRKQNRIAESVAMYERVAEIYREQLAADHPWMSALEAELEGLASQP